MYVVVRLPSNRGNRCNHEIMVYVAVKREGLLANINNPLPRNRKKLIKEGAAIVNKGRYRIEKL
jgi:hypothetical protein